MYDKELFVDKIKLPVISTVFNCDMSEDGYIIACTEL